MSQFKTYIISYETEYMRDIFEATVTVQKGVLVGDCPDTPNALEITLTDTDPKAVVAMDKRVKKACKETGAVQVSL